MTEKDPTWDGFHWVVLLFIVSGLAIFVWIVDYYQLEMPDQRFLIGITAGIATVIGTTIYGLWVLKQNPVGEEDV